MVDIPVILRGIDDGASDTIKNVNRQLETTSSILRNAGLSARKAFSFVDMGLDDITPKLKNANREIKRFDGAMLSIMFLGMAFQRVFMKALRAIFGGMREVLGDTHEFSVAVDSLKAAFGFLKFSIIEALTQSELFAQLVDWIIRIVEGIGDFISKNPELAKFIVIFLVIGLAIAFVAMWLAILGLGLAGITAKITALGGAAAIFSGISAFISTVLIPILIVVAAIILLWMTNLGNFRDFVKETLGIIWITFKMIFSKIWSFLSNVFKAIGAIFKGEWGLALAYLINALVDVLALVIQAILGVGAIIVNIFKWVWNMVIDLFFKVVVNGVLSLVKAISNALGKIPGLRKIFEPITSGLNTAISGVSKFADGLKTAYITTENIKSSFGAIDKFGEGIKESVSFALGVTTVTPGELVKTVSPITPGVPTPTTTVINNTVNVDVPPGASIDDFIKTTTEAIMKINNSNLITDLGVTRS